MIQDFIYFFHFYLRFNCDFLDAADNDKVHAMLYPSKFQMTIIYISLVRKLPELCNSRPLYNRLNTILDWEGKKFPKLHLTRFGLIISRCFISFAANCNAKIDCG